jgi:DNA polymerase III delta subunit
VAKASGAGDAIQISREKADKMRDAIEQIFEQNGVKMTPALLLTLSYSTDINITDD